MKRVECVINSSWRQNSLDLSVNGLLTLSLWYVMVTCFTIEVALEGGRVAIWMEGVGVSGAKLLEGEVEQKITSLQYTMVTYLIHGNGIGGMGGRWKF